MDKITAAEAEILAAAKAGETPLRSLTKAQAHALASDAIECEIATLEAMRSHPLSSEMSKAEILTQLTAEEVAILRYGEVALSATLRWQGSPQPNVGSNRVA